MHYQHDLAPSIRQYLNGKFGNRWIGRSWPSRSPDMTPLDFFLCGTMKEHVYGQVIVSLY